MNEVRIEVAYHNLYESDCSALCFTCEKGAQVDLQCALSEESGLVPWTRVFNVARTKGLDTGRVFRMQLNMAGEYVEFWQTPTPTPNDALREAGALQAVA
jgi:GTP cyclohydrolase III